MIPLAMGVSTAATHSLPMTKEPNKSSRYSSSAPVAALAPMRP